MATVAAKAASAWWMADVEKAHETLLSLIDELEALTGEAAPDMARVAGVRWKLSQASRQRRTVLDNHVYPDLARRAAPADLARLQRLKDKEAELMAQSARHIAQWTTEKIAADWRGYGRASAAIRGSMRRRIAQEKELLFLLAGGSAPAR